MVLFVRLHDAVGNHTGLLIKIYKNACNLFDASYFDSKVVHHSWPFTNILPSQITLQYALKEGTLILMSMQDEWRES